MSGETTACLGRTTRADPYVCNEVIELDLDEVAVEVLGLSKTSLFVIVDIF